MHRYLSRGFLTGVALLAGSACGNDNTGPLVQTSFSATLTGAAERPNPVITAATGTATVVIDETAQTLTFNVTVQGLTDISMAHIHVGDANTAGPVSVNLLAAPPNAGPFSGVLTAGTAPGSAVGGGETFATLVAKIRAGQAYVNVHTIANSAGHIRGQLVAQ